MALLSDIKQDLKQAMLEKNDLVRDTIRMFLSEVQRYEIDNKEEVDDTKALQIINKMIKQRNDSISQFRDGGRDDFCLLYTSPSPRDSNLSRMPSSA